MKKNRNMKTIAIVALLLAITSVSLGFAMFSKNLTINVNGTITPADNVQLHFSGINGGLSSGVVLPTSGTGTASVSESNNKLININATFKKPGDTTVFELYTTNTSEYILYLKSVIFSNTKATCTFAESTDLTYQNNICDNMTMTVVTAGRTINYANNLYTNITTNNAIAAKDGSTFSSAPITITLKYGGNTYADEVVTVDFGSISLNYNTVN